MAAPSALSAAVTRAQPADVGSSSLPRTGAAIALMTAIGAALVITGATIRRLAATR